MKLLERVQGAAGRLKVFPLPSLVLFPGTAAPLHIFEPRYREMVKDALATDGVFALAQVPSHAVGDLAGSPPLLPIVSVGVVSLHDELSDGRYNLMLTGVCRGRLIAEHPSGEKPYREFQVELLPDSEAPAGETELKLKRAVLDLAARLPEKAAESLLKVVSRAKGGGVADVVAATLVNNVKRRLELLELLDAEQRMRQVLDEVMAVIGRLKNPSASGGYLN